MNTLAEENYLKSIFHLQQESRLAETNQLAIMLKTKPSSVTDMLKKLAGKALVSYTPYQGACLSPAGEAVALNVIRKHRLWEFFFGRSASFPMGSSPRDGRRT